MKNRVLSIFLALIMILSVFPIVIFADGYDTDPSDSPAEPALRNMAASVTACKKLSYKATAQPLLEAGYTAKDNATGESITDAVISYACTTKADTEAGVFDASKLNYEYTIPMATDAGDYVVFYKVEKDGYLPYPGHIEVNIAKANTTLRWKADGFIDGKSVDKIDNAGNPVAEDFYKAYSAAAAALPVAEYDCLKTNAAENATVTVTAKPSTSDGTLKAVGSYTLTASISDNYEIANPTCTLLIDGALIDGYDLCNTDEGSAVWYDGNNHAVAQLIESEGKTQGVTVRYSLNGGDWQSSVPAVKKAGKYQLTMKVTADSCYDFTDSVYFEIKAVQYAVERTDYVAGWDLVLVYTNEAVPSFRISGSNMYDVSSLGYKYGTIWGASETVTVPGTEFSHVYALVVKGDADVTKIVPSNELALTINSNPSLRNDVNNSGVVDINDLIAVHATYNVNPLYMNREQMSIVLRADVSGNKKVDMYDCSVIKLAGCNDN